jgi:hypothetical protein
LKLQELLVKPIIKYGTETYTWTDREQTAEMRTFKTLRWIRAYTIRQKTKIKVRDKVRDNII